MDHEDVNRSRAKLPATAAMADRPYLSNHSSSFKHYKLNNTIHTSSDDDYVFQIDSSHDSALMAASLSTNSIKLYSPTTGQYVGDCSGHSATINHISFSSPLSHHVLHSCSSDGTIRVWDCRAPSQVSEFIAGDLQEVFSFSFGGSNGFLLAAGCKSQICFWDWRSQKKVASLEECHTDDVTQVLFYPHCQSKLLSASVDGLICSFQTYGEINDDDQMESVMNVGTSISKVGFMGMTCHKIWCLTHVEGLSLWNLKDMTMESDFKDTRTLASKKWALGPVDYLINCYTGEEGELWVAGGVNGGSVGVFPVQKGGEIGFPRAVLIGGHTEVVRDMLISQPGGATATRGSFCWTGGEDGCLCNWTYYDDDYGHDTTGSHPCIRNSASVMKSCKSYRKSNRHNPYN